MRLRDAVGGGVPGSRQVERKIAEFARCEFRDIWCDVGDVLVGTLQWRIGGHNVGGWEF